MKKIIKPVVPLWQDPKWVYVPSVATNIMARFKQFGFVPPTEQKNS